MGSLYMELFAIVSPVMRRAQAAEAEAEAEEDAEGDDEGDDEARQQAAKPGKPICPSGARPCRERALRPSTVPCPTGSPHDIRVA